MPPVPPKASPGQAGHDEFFRAIADVLKTLGTRGKWEYVGYGILVWAIWFLTKVAQNEYYKQRGVYDPTQSVVYGYPENIQKKKE